MRRRALSGWLAAQKPPTPEPIRSVSVIRVRTGTRRSVLSFTPDGERAAFRFRMDSASSSGAPPNRECRKKPS